MPISVSKQSLKKWAVGLCLAMTTGGVLSQEPSSEVVLNEIVARVNQDIITKLDLEQDLQRLKGDLQNVASNLEELEVLFEERKKKRLQEMIEVRLMLQMAAERGIDASAINHDVDQYIQSLMDQNGIPDAKVLDQVLQQRGSNLKEYRKMVQDRMIIDGLRNQTVYGRITVLTPEIQTYYQNHQKDFTLPPEVRLSEIAFLHGNKPQEIIQIMAEGVLLKLEKGESFEDLAREYSEGDSAQQGGDIGIFKVANLSEKVAKIAFSLENGQHSGIIENDWGLQIIKVAQKVSERVRPMEEVRQDIVQKIYEEKAQPELTAFLDRLIQDSYIFIPEKYREQFDIDGF